MKKKNLNHYIASFVGGSIGFASYKLVNHSLLMLLTITLIGFVVGFYYDSILAYFTEKKFLKVKEDYIEFITKESENGFHPVDLIPTLRGITLVNFGGMCIGIIPFIILPWFIENSYVLIPLQVFVIFSSIATYFTLFEKDSYDITSEQEIDRLVSKFWRDCVRRMNFSKDRFDALRIRDAFNFRNVYDSNHKREVLSFYSRYEMLFPGLYSIWSQGFQPQFRKLNNAWW